jgi:serine/threonine protein kinase
VEHDDGRKAFLKALDFSSALRDSDPAEALRQLTSAFVFERNVNRKCATDGLKRIVRCIGDGSIRVTDKDDGIVQYLILELADGDVRNLLSSWSQVNDAWILGALHHAAVGLHELHSKGIAHQDLKPSNMLTFGTGSCKIGDLGRCAYSGHSSPHKDQRIAGDWSYAPPELLYNEIPNSWEARHMACDLYLLGSMVVFMFCGITTTGALLARLPQDKHYLFWRGFYRDLLPFVQNAFADLIVEISGQVPEWVRPEIIEIVRQLCQPDPEHRGHPRNLQMPGNMYSSERYISRFNYLATRAERRLWLTKS